MKEIPSKLSKVLDRLLPEERDKQVARFHHFHNLAIANAFQSPVFWASRMILSERNDVEINRLIAKRVKKSKIQTKN